MATAKAAPEGAGDVWTWTAIDADSRLIVSFFVGDRSGESAMVLMDDLRTRLSNRVQLTTDGHKAYLEAVEGAFGGDLDYAQLVKMYGESVGPKGRYSPADCTGIKKIKVEGEPDIKHVSTSYVERQKPNQAHVYASVHTFDYRLLKKAGQSHSRIGALFRVSTTSRASTRHCACRLQWRLALPIVFGRLMT